ncbi:MAG: 50S ribosomal protein L15 [Candidatus Caldatribacteriota bacterium]
MKLDNLSPAPHSIKKQKRVGRGCGSGHGFTSGRGSKGQKSRSGAKIKRGFEGGQMPLYRRIPKRGFINVFKKKIIPVNLERLNIFNEGETITPQKLIEAGIIKKIDQGVKILAKGKINKKLIVQAHQFSQQAIKEIESIGGKIEVI